MKTKLYLTVIAVLFVSGFISCKKEGHGRHGNGGSAAPATIILNASVKSGDTYRLNLNLYGNGNASIIQQASAYTISQVSKDAIGNNIYQYSSSLNPKAGNNNTDEVMLRISSTRQNGGGCDHDGNDDNGEKNIKIRFTVN